MTREDALQKLKAIDLELRDLQRSDIEDLKVYERVAVGSNLAEMREAVLITCQRLDPEFAVKGGEA